LGLCIVRCYLAVAGVSGAIAVGLGAFAAHGLKHQLTGRLLDVFQTGVQYQFYHTLALLLIGLLLSNSHSRWLKVSGALFILGMLFFSGSLYVLALSGIHWFGVITPVGGVALLAGWLSLVGFVVSEKRNGE